MKTKHEEILEEEPDYYICMCCGNVQGSGMSCNKCCGPMRKEYYYMLLAATR